jgi:hypothetical protein
MRDKCIELQGQNQFTASSDAQPFSKIKNPTRPARIGFSAPDIASI